MYRGFGKRCRSFFVEDLTPREATGDIVGLSLRAHRGRVGCQVTRGGNQHMCAYRGVTQMSILPEGSFDGLYRMEVTVLPEEQASHHGQEPVGVSPTVEVVGDQCPRCIYLLPFIKQRRKSPRRPVPLRWRPPAVLLVAPRQWLPHALPTARWRVPRCPPTFRACPGRSLEC